MEYNNMREEDLKNLSKDQLIKMLLKRENQKKLVKDPFIDHEVKKEIKSSVVDKLKKYRKKNKKLDAELDRITDKFNKLFPEKREIVMYPKETVSVDKFRREEAALTNNFKKGSTFVNLFENRLKKMKGKWEDISITLFVDIDNGLITENKTYGPFETRIPELTKSDMYKFMLYKLLDNNFTLLSAQVITKIGCKILTHNKKFFMKHFMGGLKLNTYLLCKQRPIKTHGENTCVLDYVWDQVRGKRGFKTYDYDKLKEELYSYASEKPRINTEELIQWAKECHSNVSIHAFDSTYRKFVGHTNHCSDVSLVYIVKDHHCFPITDEKLKQIASKANAGGAENLLKYMTDIRWTRRHEKVHELKKIDDIFEVKEKNNIIILPEEVKMNKAIQMYISSSNFYVEYLHWNNNGVLDGFIDHNKNMYLLNDNYKERKSICDKLLKKYKTEDFVWTNQSFTSLSSSLFRQITGYLPESTYNVHTRQILDEYYPRALQWCTDGDVPDDMVSIDISKSYPNILLNNNTEIPIYNIHDTIKKFNNKNDLKKCGEFYLIETVLENFKTPIKIEAGFYSSNLVFYLVDTLNMPLTQIKYMITTKRALKPDTFKTFIEYLFNEFPEKEAKMLANSFIGELGRKYNKTNTGFTCTEYDTAMACWTRAMADKRNVTVDHFNDIFLVKEQTCERIFSDNTSINRFVVSEAILKLLELIWACHGKDSVLYAYNTDGIFITNPKIQFKNKKDVKFKTSRIGRPYVTDTVLTYFEKRYRENMDFDSYEIKQGKGVIYTGQAGSGKTTKLCEMVLKAENPIVLSFTNKAVENVKDRLWKMKRDENKFMRTFNGKTIDLSSMSASFWKSPEVNNICHTFDSYFCEWNGRGIDDLKDKTIFIEEFSMVPNRWMTKIYETFMKYNNIVYMFGDPNQCEPVEAGSQIHNNYLESETVKQMCPKVRTLAYKEDSCRYDKRTHNMLQTFLKHGKVSAHFDEIGIYFKNICYLNSTRIKINGQCCDIFTKDKKYETLDFKYDGKKETYKICAGMPFIATTNIKDREIFNTMEFCLEKIKNGECGMYFRLNDKSGEWFDEKEFTESFIPAFCVTVYKYQGCDINEHYNIHDVNRMDKKQLYTALSRTTKYEYIHAFNRQFNNMYFVRKQPLLELTNARLNSLYKNGKIYKVTFNDKKIYIGSTCEELETRLKWHLTNNKSQVYKNKDKSPKIELLINAPCNDKKTLEKIETSYIEYYANKYKEMVLNVRGNPSKKAKKIEYKVEIENDKQLRERIAKLEGKIDIKDNAEKKFWYYDTVVDGKRYKTMARYEKEAKDKAYENISVKKQELIKKLTVYFE